MLAQLSRIERLITQHQNLGIVLLLPDDELSEIDWPCDVHRIGVVNSHPIQIPIIGYPPQGRVFLHIAEKAHPLQPTMPDSFISSQG